MNIKINLPEDLSEIIEIFKASNKQLFLVGGSIRDILLGENPKDYDVATNATPDEIIDILSIHDKYQILSIGKSFGVIKVVTNKKNEYEIATFRSDIGSGRRPDSVIFTTIDEDVKRRDFTINALFYDFDKNQIIDLVGGLEDIKTKTIRTVGNPQERFSEDRLRILRAIRFAARFGNLHEETYKTIKKSNSLIGVSEERIKDEFLKGIKSSRNSVDFFQLIEDLDLWSQIFPGLSISKPYLKNVNIPVMLATLLRNNEYKVLKEKLNKLKYSNIEIAQILFLHEFQFLNVNNAFSLKKQYQNSYLKDIDLIDYATITQNLNMKFVNAFLLYQPSTSGEELLKLGFTGKQLGQEMSRIEMEKFKCLIL